MPSHTKCCTCHANMQNPLRLPRKTTSERPKVLHTPIFALLTSKCALRHNCVHFFDMSTSKSGPSMVCLTWKFASRHNGVHFSIILASKSGLRWSETVSFLHFWLGNVLRATTACTFSTSQLLKVLRCWCALYILTSKCASRHNGMQFFLSHLARWLRTRRFSEPTFRPAGATNHWKKHSVSRLSYLFGHLYLLSSDSFSSLIFSLLLFSSLTLPTYAFHVSIPSEVWQLNFLW